MSRGAPVRRLIANEARALLPVWIAGVLAATIATLTSRDVHQFSQFACVAAIVALGAQSIGQEYAHRTLGLMLTLPLDRRRLFLAKQAVVAAMVLPLAAYAWLLGLLVDVPAPTPWLIAAVALCLAPALTMLCRSALAGTVFSMSMPWIVLIVVMLASGTTFDALTQAERATLDTWSRLMIPVLAGGAVLGWWLFMRLESLEGGTSGIQLRWWTEAPQTMRRKHPIWQLVKKELRLQQMTFVITALYLAACAASVVLHIPGPGRNVSFIGAATAIYALGQPALVGSFATAEERQLGTLAWQLQLPASAWQQWAAKVVTVFGLTLVLSIGVPVLLVPVFWSTERPFGETAVVFPVVMTAGSMYVSSLSASAVRAAVTSVVAVSLVLWLVVEPQLSNGHVGGLVPLLSALVVLLVGFAFVNHRPEPPAASRIWGQTLSLAAVIGFARVILEIARF